MTESVSGVTPGLAGQEVDERLLTAFHEAAHALVAICNGVQVYEMSIVPAQATAHSAGTLGRVRHIAPPLPREEDLWVSSWWTEVQLQISLAGYLIEDLLETTLYGHPSPGWERRHPTADHGHAVALLRAIAPRTPPDELAAHIRAVRGKTKALLLDPPGNLELLERMAFELREVGVLGGSDIYRRFFDGQCSAFHPTAPGLRCGRAPHGYGDHMCRVPTEGLPQWKWDEPFWSGFEPPDPRRKVTLMSTEWKRVRTLLQSGPGPYVPRNWRTVQDACDAMPE